jgi:glyoxylase-like metal-dependent hydrolase (beta-lactamase superfamily II)
MAAAGAGLTSVVLCPVVSRNRSSRIFSITAEVAGLRRLFVNVFFVGPPGGPWVLIDAGTPGSAAAIQRAAQERFGNAAPEAILLTHGHFDHAGSVRELAAYWGAPVYAHRAEFPFLTGCEKYPWPDAASGGGWMALLSPLFPRAPFDLRGHLQPLPATNIVPILQGWRWIHTPGHTPGHVAFFRDEDRVLIAGDAISLTKAESAEAVITQRVELHGPPAYFTPDWDAARDSVMRLSELRPAVIAAGHGLPVAGDSATEELAELALRFDELARPHRGRTVRPAVSH